MLIVVGDDYLSLNGDICAGLLYFYILASFKFLLARHENRLVPLFMPIVCQASWLQTNQRTKYFAKKLAGTIFIIIQTTST
jgi:hypothetical protein